MHLGIAVVEVSLPSAVVKLLLARVHLFEILDVVGVAHSQAVFRVGEIREDKFAPDFGVGPPALAHRHKIHIIIYVEAIYIVGVVLQQAVEFGRGGREVVELVFENHTHVVEPFLDYFVGLSFFFWRERNLSEIIFGVMRVGSGLGGLCVFGLFFAGSVFSRRVGIFGVGIFGVGIEIGGVERRLVAPAPVILELARAPALLELGFAGIARGGVVEIP